MLRLGGRGPGSLVPPGVMARGGECEWSGDKARCMREVVGSASSHCISESARKWDRDGAGMCDGVFVRERGEVAL